MALERAAKIGQWVCKDEEEEYNFEIMECESDCMLIKGEQEKIEVAELCNVDHIP